MGSNNNQNKDLQDKQADLLDQTDTQNALNKLENENELLTEVVESKDNVIKELASSAGRALQAVKKNK